jgi:proline iminopeptidase
MVEDLVHVVRWEQRGCGRSSIRLPYDLETCIADIESLRRHFGFDSWIVGGHSWGANLSLAYAVAHPERVLGIVYLAGTGLTEDWKPEYRHNRDTRGEQKPEFAYPTNLQVNEVGNASWRAYLAQDTLPKQVAGLEMPAIIVCGQRDIRPSWPSQAVAKLMSQADFELILDAEHYLWLTHASRLRSVLREFITRNFLSEGE